MIRNSLLRKIIRSSLSASEILVLLYIYSRMGDKDFLETKITEIAEHITYLSKSSVYDAVSSLSEKGYIRIVKTEKGWDKKIFRTDKRTPENGYMKLTYRIFEKIIKCKTVCSSGSTLRALLHFLFRILSGDRKGLNYKNVAVNLSEELRVSTRTAHRILKVLYDNNLIGFIKHKSGSQLSFSVWVPKDLLEVSKIRNKEINKNHHRSVFLVDHILRAFSRSASGQDKMDTAELFTQYRKRIKKLGFDEEEEIGKIIFQFLSKGNNLNPKAIHRNIQAFLRNPRRNILVTP